MGRPFAEDAIALAKAYAELEARLRLVIETVTSRVCPSCPSLCCRVHYCRATAENPWYALVNRVAGSFPIPEDWQTRKDPFGLGPGGCEIRAGRYVYCYSYNCRRLAEALPRAGAREAFQEISDLLCAVNRLPGGRLLHELAALADLTAEDLQYLRDALSRVGERLNALVARFYWVTFPARAEQA